MQCFVDVVVVAHLILNLVVSLRLLEGTTAMVLTFVCLVDTDATRLFDLKYKNFVYHSGEDYGLMGAAAVVVDDDDYIDLNIDFDD